MKNNRKRKVNKPKQKTLNRLKQFNLYFTNQPGSNAGGRGGDEKCSDFILITNFYRPQRSCGQGNIFTPVCHSVHRGGGDGGYTTRH